MTMFDRVPNVLVINSNKLPVSRVPELDRLPREKSGRVAYGSSGVAPRNILPADFPADDRYKIAHVPYPGSARMVTDMIGGQVAMAFDNVPAAAAARSGRQADDVGDCGGRACRVRRQGARSRRVPARLRGGGLARLHRSGRDAERDRPEAGQGSSGLHGRSRRRSEKFCRGWRRSGGDFARNSPTELPAGMDKWKIVIEKANLNVK